MAAGGAVDQRQRAGACWPILGRRDLLVSLGSTAVIWPFAARAQQSAMPVLGWLSPATTQSYQLLAPDSPGPAQLRAALSKYGLIDGTNIRVEIRLAEGKIERLPALAKELVESGATILLAFGEPAGKAAQAATATLPIVCVADDLVDSGMAVSLSKPGTNITNGATAWRRANYSRCPGT